MALFCADYIVSRPLIPGIPKLEIQEHASKGYYAFQDYAVAFWWRHTRDVLATPPGSDTELLRKVLRSAYRALVDASEVKDTLTLDDSPDWIQPLRAVIEKVPHSFRDWTSSQIYEIRTAGIREAIGLLFNDPDTSADSALSLYGRWGYKCPKMWCQNFSRGFEQEKTLEVHVNQHDNQSRWPVVAGHCLDCERR